MQDQMPIKWWGATDEARLQALLQQKADFEKTARWPVEAVAAPMLRAVLGAPTPSIAVLTEALIAHADELRDALAPFDSGVRPA